MITIKPISAYYSDSDKAIFSHKESLLVTAKRLHTDLATVEAIITKGEEHDPDKESRVASLIAGETALRPEPLTARRTELQLAIKDIEDALNLVVRKEGKAKYEAGKRLAKDITKQHDIAAKELADALVVAHEKQVVLWNAKHHLFNNSVGYYHLFSADADEVLGSPVDGRSALASFFKDAAKSGFLKTVPVSLR